MITKTKFWMSIRQQLKNMEQSKKFTAAIMQKIKDTPQDENKKKET